MKRFVHMFLISIGLVLSTGIAKSQLVDKDALDLVVKSLNSRWDEQHPVLHPDGRTLYFTRANDSLNVGGATDKGDIWFAQLDEDGRWGQVQHLGPPVNDELLNSLIGFSPDGKIMFLNKQMKHPGGLVSYAGVAYALQKDGGWSEPKNLPIKYFLNRSKNQSGSLSKDGKVMVLSLEAYASRGGEDIYVSFYENGIWSQPQNVGSDINTPLQEMTPFISADHNTLYFSSNGHGGAGGRDLFMVTRQDDTWRSWSAPVPVVGDINSNGVELSYWIDYLNEIAYYTTTQNSDGYGDIRAAKITGAEVEEMEEELFEELVAPEEEAVVEATPKEQVFRGLVINAKDERPIAAAVHVRGTDLDKNMGTDGTIGTFEVSVPTETEELFISVKAPGYMGIEERVGLSGSGLNEATFALNPLEVGATIQLNKVYFERGKAILIDSSYAELDRLTDMLMENPEVKIELAGHTDNQGSSKLNLQLSKDRVEVVVDYLVDKGIDAKRIRGKGYGGTRPVASNASEATRRLNRRVEFTILKK